MSQTKLSGNLTKDPQFFSNENSSDVVMFTIAENVNKDTEYAKTYYHSVKVRGAKAKAVASALSKGALVKIEGALESYTKEGVFQTDKDGAVTTYPVVFWGLTAFVVDVYDRENSGWKSVIKSEPKGDKAESKSGDDDEAGEVKTKDKAKKTESKAATPASDDDDEF